MTSYEILVSGCTHALENGNKIMIAGNGGSSAQADHFAGELVCDGYASISLTNSAIITALANDYEYADVFKIQLEALGKAGDVFIGLSTSGLSLNITTAMNTAWSMGMDTFIITRKIAPITNDCTRLEVDSTDTQYIQEQTLKILHRLWKDIKVVNYENWK